MLARRASAITPPGAVAGWLHGVACRVARDVRRSMRRRSIRERPADELPDTAARECDSPDDADLRAVIDDELGRLPAKYREALVACDLEGRARRSVAAALEIPEGTLSSRLAAARKMLAARLAKRGLVPAVVAGVAAGSSGLEACEVPRALLASAARIGSDAAGTVPVHVEALADGAIRAMSIRTLLPWAAGLLVVMSAVALAARPAAEPPTPPTPPTRTLALIPGNDPVPAKAEPKPPVPRPTKLLVYRSRKLELLDLDGKNAITVMEATGTQNPREARLSPDGKRAAIIRVEVRPPVPAGTEPVAVEAKTSLVVQELGSDKPATDLKASCKMFAWSPDGSEIACSEAADRPTEKGPKVSHFVVNVKTGKQTPLPLPDNHFLTDWSRDGKFFLTNSYTQEDGKPVVRIHLMNRDGTEHKAVTDGKRPVVHGKFSPDGKRALCHLMPEEKGKPGGPIRELAILDLATGKWEKVADTPLNGDLTGFCWSPDGKRIAYSWRQAHEGKPEDLINKETESHLVVCDPDGKNQKTILTEKARSQWQIVLAGVDWQFVSADLKSDEEKLAGKWTIESIMDEGKAKDTENGVMVFTKGKVTFTAGNRTKEGTYQLDPAKKPKWFDLTIDGRTYVGIYELDGDTLRICTNEKLDGERPTRFVSERGTPNDQLIVLKRETP